MVRKKWYFWSLLPSRLRHFKKSKDAAKKKKFLEKVKENFVNERKDDLSNMIKRYSELKDIKFIFVEGVLMDKLKQCIYTYTEGRYLSTISLCGIMAEDVTIDVFVSSTIKANKNVLGQKAKREAFRTLTQEHRTKFLFDLKLIDEETAGKLNEIRIKRNSHVHPKGGVSEKKDSLTMLNLLIDLLHKVYRPNKIPFDVFLKSLGKGKQEEA